MRVYVNIRECIYCVSWTVSVEKDILQLQVFVPYIILPGL